jgi:hypothetical protein
LNGRRRFGCESVGVILDGAAKVVGISVFALVGPSIAGTLDPSLPGQGG